MYETLTSLSNANKKKVSTNYRCQAQEFYLNILIYSAQYEICEETGL